MCREQIIGVSPENEVDSNLRWLDVDYSSVPEIDVSQNCVSAVYQSSKALTLLESLEEEMEQCYGRFALTPYALASYRMYGGGKRRINAPTDNVRAMIDQVCEHDWLDPKARLACVIGGGYPLTWRESFPDLEITAFDINPLQHAIWTSAFGDPKKGVDRGCLVDVGVKGWFEAFMAEVRPTGIYLSNIVSFLSSDSSQVKSLTNGIEKFPPALVMMTGVREMEGGLQLFVKRMRRMGYEEYMVDTNPRKLLATPGLVFLR